MSSTRPQQLVQSEDPSLDLAEFFLENLLVMKKYSIHRVDFLSTTLPRYGSVRFSLVNQYLDDRLVIGIEIRTYRDDLPCCSYLNPITAGLFFASRPSTNRTIYLAIHEKLAPYLADRGSQDNPAQPF